MPSLISVRSMAYAKCGVVGYCSSLILGLLKVATPCNLDSRCFTFICTFFFHTQISLGNPKQTSRQFIVPKTCTIANSELSRFLMRIIVCLPNHSPTATCLSEWVSKDRKCTYCIVEAIGVLVSVFLKMWTYCPSVIIFVCVLQSDTGPSLWDYEWFVIPQHVAVQCKHFRPWMYGRSDLSGCHFLETSTFTWTPFTSDHSWLSTAEWLNHLVVVFEDGRTSLSLHCWSCQVAAWDKCKRKWLEQGLVSFPVKGIPLCELSLWKVSTSSAWP